MQRQAMQSGALAQAEELAANIARMRNLVNNPWQWIPPPPGP